MEDRKDILLTVPWISYKGGTTGISMLAKLLCQGRPNLKTMLFRVLSSSLNKLIIFNLILSDLSISVYNVYCVSCFDFTKSYDLVCIGYKTCLSVNIFFVIYMAINKNRIL